MKRPWAVALGLVAHYVIMPGLGWAVAHLLDLPPQLAAGVILVGCAPSGTASNVVTYLARGDVALSVSVATVSTLVAPLVTPPLTLLLAGEYLPVDAGSMVTDILKTVLLPVLAGLAVRLLAGRYVERALPVLPWLSAVTVSVIVAVVVAGSAEAIKSAAAMVFLAVVLHNGLGLALGYGAGRLGRLGEPRAVRWPSRSACRTPVWRLPWPRRTSARSRPCRRRCSPSGTTSPARWRRPGSRAGGGDVSRGGPSGATLHSAT